jgi:hypothetical protein
MPLDFQGNVVSVIQVIALFMLVIGVYPYRIRTKNRNLIMHGFFSIAAIGLNIATAVLIMIPVFIGNFVFISNLSLVQLSVVWLHAVLGISANVLGLIIIFSWITHPLGELGCSKMWRLMMPTFIILTVTLVLGLAIHVYSII